MCWRHWLDNQLQRLAVSTKRQDPKCGCLWSVGVLGRRNKNIYSTTIVSSKWTL
uniref:Uncharacterized protein n=1 Tax=Rhizophora mucronata TaxID=61149 RepID=A0A2P2PVM4_RHIMU